MKRASLVLLAFWLCAWQTSHAGVQYILSPDGAAVFRLTDPGTPLTVSTFDAAVAGTTFSNYYNLSNVAKSQQGDLTVFSYDAAWGSTTLMGGGRIKATYLSDMSFSLPTTTSKMEWVQVFSTNYYDNTGPEILSATTTGVFLDNVNKEGLTLTGAFYPFTDQNRSALISQGVLVGMNIVPQNNAFYDWPRRPTDPFNPVPAGGPSWQGPNPWTGGDVTWDAKLYAVITDSATPNLLTVVDGLSWGWNMEKATVGTLTGAFSNPAPSTAVTSIVNGTTTSSFSWGVPFVDSAPGSLTFTPEATFDTFPATEFKLGRLTFHNGTLEVGTEATAVDFDVTLNFANLPEMPVSIKTRFSINNTINTGNPTADADSVSLEGFVLPSTFSVLEGETASVDVFARLATNRTLTGTRGGFVNNDFLGSEDPDTGSTVFALEIVGFANPSQGGFLMPEPPTSLLLALCLGLLAWGRRQEILQFRGSRPIWAIQ